MIACQRCGYQNHPTSKFCASCGGPMPAAQAGAAQHQPPQAPGGWAAQPPAPQVPPQYGAPPGPPQHAPAGPPGWGPPQGPPAGAPPGQPMPHPGWGQPPGTPQHFSPEHARIGSAQQGLNPFGATMAPDPDAVGHYGAPPHPAGAGPAGMPGAAHHAPPGVPQAPPVDPSAYAATASPPIAGQYGHGPSPQRDSQAHAHGGYGPPPAVPAQPGPPVYGHPDTTQSSAGNAATEPDKAAQHAQRVLAGFMVSYDVELGKAWHLYQGSNSIGRLEAAEGLDIEIDHPTTSSRHAVIQATARPGRMTLEDLGSTNGTFRGDARLEPGQAVELRDGDSIRFGGFSVIIKII